MGEKDERRNLIESSKTISHSFFQIHEMKVIKQKLGIRGFLLNFSNANKNGQRISCYSILLNYQSMPFQLISLLVSVSQEPQPKTIDIRQGPRKQRQGDVVWLDYLLPQGRLSGVSSWWNTERSWNKAKVQLLNFCKLMVY